MNKFKIAEEKYSELKAKLDRNEINAEEMKNQLKEIMVTDDNGNYWMIGGKSGKWYRYHESEKEWKESDPFQEPAVETQRFVKKEEPVEQNQELELKIEEPGQRICKFCKSRISSHALYCPICGGNQKETEKISTVKPLKGESELLVKSIKFIPMIFFFGGLGLIIGILFGATFGIFNILGDFIYQFPVMLQETRGKIQGGLIFAAMGGISGFMLLAFFSVIVTGIYNFIAFFFGGLRFKIKS
jgi:hypothetical protein